MSAPAASPGSDANPFGPRAVLLLVAGGAALFVALLWLIGAGLTGGSVRDGGGHAGGTGLNGYAAFADYLEARGFAVRRSQSSNALDDRGLLVLTPPAGADGKQLDRIVARRRYVGPTLVITPKWAAYPLPARTSGAKRGWVALGGIAPPEWRGFLDQVTVRVAPVRNPGWHTAELAGRLPAPNAVLSGEGAGLVPLVEGERGRILAAFVDDGGFYPDLADMARQPNPGGEDKLFPVVLVFEPDLLDNYAMRDVAAARLGERLVRASGEDGRGVIFDLTLNGFTRSPNLLTLAFTPPFLAATLCLLLAAIAAGWRGFARFGPPLRAPRAIAFGKRALIANTAGLIGRSGRMHLVAAPYAAQLRRRLTRSLGLPSTAGVAAADAAIDRALARRRGGGPAFAEAVSRLESARRPREVLAAAQDLHAAAQALNATERTLAR